MPSAVIFAGVIVVLLFFALIWTNVKFFRQEKTGELSKQVPSESVEQIKNVPAQELTHERIVIQEESVPLFADEKWKHVFYQLAKEEKILGWIAFQNGNAGAGDRIYDPEFLTVLLKHHAAVMGVQKEIGLSVLQETLVRGNEGDVWFVYAEDGVWFSLFSAVDESVREVVKCIHEALPSHI